MLSKTFALMSTIQLAQLSYAASLNLRTLRGDNNGTSQTNAIQTVLIPEGTGLSVVLESYNDDTDNNGVIEFHGDLVVKATPGYLSAQDIEYGFCFWPADATQQDCLKVTASFDANSLDNSFLNQQFTVTDGYRTSDVDAEGNPSAVLTDDNTAEDSKVNFIRSLAKSSKTYTAPDENGQVEITEGNAHWLRDFTTDSETQDV